jgi:intracellular multiplication protein IcmP
MSGKAEEDPTWTLLFIVCLLLGAIWGIWHFFQHEILWILRGIRLGEIGLQSLFSSRAHACLTWLWRADVGHDIPSTPVVEAALACYGPDIRALPPLEALDYYNFTPTSLAAMTRLVASPLRWILGLAAGGVCVYAIYFTPLNRFKVKHSLESFIKFQASMWPVISPIVGFNPTKTSARIPGEPIPDKLPLFAEALAPEEWVAYHRIPVVNSVPDREQTRQAFQLQLGPRWTGTAGLPPYLLGLFAAFALQGAQKREAADSLLGQLSLAWSATKGFHPSAELMHQCRKHAEDPAIGGKALQVAKKHAYRATVFLGLLKWARAMGGVLAPGQFLWLRGEDRTLWYPLNNLGRRAFLTEGAGAIAHFMAEEAAGRALPIPRIETAIITLNTYFAKGSITVPPRAEPAAIKGRARRV